MAEEIETYWSEWIDFNKTNVEVVPELPGVYMMHTAMKILYIGSSINLRQSLLESISHSCINEAKRFRYMTTQSNEKMKEKLLNEYREKHGKLPKCMDKI